MLRSLWWLLRRRKLLCEALQWKVDAVGARYAQGKGKHAPEELQAFNAFLEVLSDKLREVRVTKIAQLSAADAWMLLAAHAAVFDDDEAFAEALRGQSTQLIERLQKLRLDTTAFRISGETMAVLRKVGASPATAPIPPAAARPSGMIDLESLLGPKDPRTRRARLLTWLQQQAPDPDLWHQIVTSSDPDGMDNVFLWIVRQPQCDAATAAFIFHAVNAFDVLETKDHVRIQITTTIVDRWNQNDFRSYDFAFEQQGYEEPLDSYRELEARAAALFGAPAFVAPEGLFRFRRGRAPKTKYFYSDFDTFASTHAA